jgi:ABC-2 type transport system permease protein
MTWRSTLLVIERELREAARRKGLWLLALGMFLGSCAIVFLPDLLADDGPGEATVVIAGDDEAGVVAALGEVDDPVIEVTSAADRAAVIDAVESGDADLGVVLAEDDAALIVDDPGDGIVGIVATVVADRRAADRLDRAGIDPAEVEAAFVAASPTIEPVDVERSDREAAAFIVMLVLYLLIVILTSQIASAVAVEKSNRVSEVLLAIVPPRALLFGKVIGIGCIGVVTLGLVALPVLFDVARGATLPSGIGVLLLASAVWFVGGLALYLIIAGALGALVSRQEEIGPLVVPLTMVLVVAYFATISFGDGPYGAVLSYIPLTSPMSVPYRIGVGAGSTLEYVASAVLLFAGVALAARVGAVVFRRAVVRTGRRLSLRDVLAS